jgi:dephospho-CoA kinase
MIPCQHPEEPSPRGRWKHGAIPVIGLVGGIGSGKSRVARLLGARGAAVIDADTVGHELLQHPTVRARVLERFGPGVLAEPAAVIDGDAAAPIDRRALGAIVFADPSARGALEAILHPLMRNCFLSAIEIARRSGAARWVVLDAAILLEAGWDDLCDRIVFVDAPRPERLRRVARARGWSEQTFEARERAQWPAEEKHRRAHWSLTNDAGLERLDAEVDRLLSWLQDAMPPADASLPLRREAQAAAPSDPIPDRMVLSPPTALGRIS